MTNTSFNLENGIFLPFSPEATGVGIPGQFTTWSTDNKIGPAGTPSGALLDQLTGFSSTGILQRTGAGAYSFLPPFIGSNTAAIVADGSQANVQNSVTAASDIYSGIVPPGSFFSDVIRAVGVMPISSSVTSFSCHGAYLKNNCVSTGSHGNAVGFFSVGISNVDGASTWGANFTLNDDAANGNIATSNRKLLGIELDFTVSSNNAGTLVQGMSVILNGLRGNISSGNGFQVSTTSASLAKWTNGLVIDDGATSSHAIVVGASAKSGTSIQGQAIQFNYFDSGGVEHGPVLKVDATGALVWPNTLSVPSLEDASGGANSTVTLGTNILMNTSGNFFFQNLGGGTTYLLINGAGVSPSGNYFKGGNQVVGARQTGWTVATGTPSRATYATSTVSLATLAGVVMALQQDLITHGLIGA